MLGMMEGEDLLYRPVLRGILDPRALDDGSISLGRIMLLNEAIDVEDENKHRFAIAIAEKQKREAAQNRTRRY